MKWINEKTVQGEPMDTKNCYIPKEEYNIPLVNEGIQEGQKLVRCKDCKYRDNDYCKEHHDHIDRDEFCSRGEKRDG